MLVVASAFTGIFCILFYNVFGGKENLHDDARSMQCVQWVAETAYFAMQNGRFQAARRTVSQDRNARSATSSWSTCWQIEACG